ncbi:MAG TPA: capsular biosynthesis protein [Novosphingobium sp.]|nr:capsular biosynthesis protein [Novosphingobium sp.]
MTEQSKIPVPPTDDSADKGTLIERVVRNYDLVRLGPPPIPEELLAPKARHANRYRRQADVDAEAAVEPLVEAAPEVVTPEVMAAVPAAPRAAATPVIAPVEFSGPRHKVDRQHLRDQGLIVPEGSVTALLEEFRIVKRQLMLTATELRQQGAGPSAQRVLICSPHPGEGKTYTALNLALSIAAEKESEVLLVDADFAKPSVLSALGLPGGPGFMDALADPELDPVDCVLGTDIPGLWVLPAGNATNSDSEFLSTSRTASVIDRLTQGAPHRFVIFDSPPALAASPAAELAKFVGQALVVARADRTGQGALEDAISLLSGCPNIQLLLNAVHFNPTGRRFGSYYGYGG